MSISLSDFDVFSAEEINPQMKATVHRSGKLGFSTNAITGLDLSPDMGAIFLRPKGSEDGMQLYMIITKEPDKRAFKIVKAGSYYYVSSRNFFTKLGIDFNNKTIIYDLTEEEIEGIGKVVKMKGRVSGGKPKLNIVDTAITG